MTHEDLIDALSKTSLRYDLITAVSQVVKERDAALRELEISEAEHDAMAGVARVFCDYSARAEKKLQQQRADHAATIERLAEVTTERDAARDENAALRAALSTIAGGIDPYADQTQNWIAGQIDAALVPPPDVSL